jgi:hypothetical protein
MKFSALCVGVVIGVGVGVARARLTQGAQKKRVNLSYRSRLRVSARAHPQVPCGIGRGVGSSRRRIEERG